jgi:hypothetical protein
MNNITVLGACCVALCITGFFQNSVCGKKHGTCYNVAGGMGCLICLISLFLILKK